MFLFSKLVPIVEGCSSPKVTPVMELLDAAFLSRAPSLRPDFFGSGTAGPGFAPVFILWEEQLFSYFFFIWSASYIQTRLCGGRGTPSFLFALKKESPPCAIPLQPDETLVELCAVFGLPLSGPERSPFIFRVARLALQCPPLEVLSDPSPLHASFSVSKIAALEFV